jgi:hypothetical protein
MCKGYTRTYVIKKCYLREILISLFLIVIMWLATIAIYDLVPGDLMAYLEVFSAYIVIVVILPPFYMFVHYVRL